jgi:phosphatidylserine synthase
MTYPVFPEPFVQGFVRVWAPLGTLVVALLMVSRVPYPHLTNQLLRGRRPFRVVVQVVLIVFVIALVPDLAFFLLFWFYALNGPIRLGIVRALRHQALPSHRPGLD